MKTTVFFSTLFACFCFKLSAQQPIDQLIASEKKFAATSKKETTKKAFLAFIDITCIGYNKGVQTAMFKEWTAREESNSKLTWNPELAIIASSGEMGVTTGPWEFRQTSLNDTPVAHGHFTTVWKKKDNGVWKAMFDMGIGYAAPATNSDEVKVKPVVLQASPVKEINWSDIDKQYSNDKTTLLSLLDADAWTSIQGHAPLKNADAVKQALDIIPGNVEFKPAGYFMSESKDLLAVYGGVIKDGKQEQAYLRVWVNKGKEWKLILMVIS